MSALLSGSRHKDCQPVAVGAWDLYAEALESACLGEQSFTPALGGEHTRLVRVSGFAPSLELRLDGSRIDFPHQPPDELKLASARLALREPLRFSYRFRELFRQGQGLQSGGA